MYGIFLTWCGIGDDSQAFFEVFRKLRQYAEEKNMTDDEKILYDLRIDAWKDYYADMDESMAEGFEKGKKEEKVMIAKNLKNMGMAIADIAAATGLSAEEVESL